MFSETPDTYIRKKVPMTEIGIETPMMSVLRSSPRKRTSTKMARMPPNTAVRSTSETDWRMYLAWSVTSVSSRPSPTCSRRPPRSSTRASTASATVTVFVPPSLYTATSMDSRPSMRVMTSRSLAPRRISATSSRRITVRAVSTTIDRMSSGRSNSLIVRTRYSAPPSSSRPAVRFTFSAARRFTTAGTERPRLATLRSSISTWISSSSPPLTSTAATPSTRSRFRCTSCSAIRRSRTRSSLPVRPKRRIGSSDGSKRRSVGRGASSGRRTTSSRSRTSSAAISMSVSQPNSSVTSLRSGREEDTTRATLFTTPTASSIGRVIRFSISLGAAPSYSVRTVSEG